jgi:non-specific serine/threonine protein kinase
MLQALGDLGDLARDRSDHARALACYREALELGRENPRPRQVTDVIESVGVVAIFAGEPEGGATLLGAAEALRERLGLRLRYEENRVALEQAVAAARAALGEPAFASAWAVGRSMGPGQAVAAALAPSLPPANTRGTTLSPREAEILRLLAAGQTDATIAKALSISRRTVENHVAHILAKLGVHSRTAATSAAIAAGLVEPTPPKPA